MLINTDEENHPALPQMWHECGVDSQLHKREIDLEEEMRSTGVERFWKTVNKMKEHGSESVTLHGIGLMKQSIVSVSKAIDDFIDEGLKGSPGRLQGGRVIPCLMMVDSDVAAYLALKMTMDGISFRQKFTRIVRNIGVALEDHIKLEMWKQEDNKKFTYIKQKMSRRSASREFRRYGMIRKCRDTIELSDLETWTRNERIQVGAKLLDLLIQCTGLVEVKTMTFSRTKKETHVIPNEKTLEWIEKVNEKGQFLSPAYTPMIVPPIPWTTPSDGGYLNIRLPMVKTTNAKLLEELKHHPMPMEYEALNALQNTPFKVNTCVLNVMSHAWNSGTHWNGIPSREPHPIPVAPVKKGLRKADMTPEQRREFVQWKTSAGEVYRENARRFSKVLAFSRTLAMSRKYDEEDRFYFVHQSDFRGRKYTVSSFLTPQGPEYAKSLLLFADGMPIETDEQADWLAIHGANCFGIDKVPYEDRVKWVDDHYDEIKASAQDPINYTWWNTGDDPWLFLAFCYEWSAFMDQGFGFISYIPVQLDGSNNGLQNFSAMLRDPIGGKATNLTSEPIPQDIYQEVADVVLTRVKELADDGDPMAQKWLDTGMISRKLTKRPVMVVPYGGTLYACRHYIEDYMRECFTEKNIPNPFKQQGDTFQPSAWMAQHVWQAISQVVVSARVAMGWVQDLSAKVSEKDLPLIWKTPTEFIVFQQYPSLKTRRVTTHIDGNLIKPVVWEQDYTKSDTRRSRNGSAPNFVHSMDASHLTFTIHLCSIAGIKHYSMIHDSYGTHAHHVPTLAKELRRAFVNLYEDHDVMEDFRRSVVDLIGEVEPCPNKGTLNLSEVLESSYFFS